MKCLEYCEYFINMKFNFMKNFHSFLQLFFTLKTYEEVEVQ